MKRLLAIIVAALLLLVATSPPAAPDVVDVAAAVVIAAVAIAGIVLPRDARRRLDRTAVATSEPSTFRTYGASIVARQHRHRGAILAPP